VHYWLDLQIQTYTEPVPLKYGQIATKHPWIYGYFCSVRSQYQPSIHPSSQQLLPSGADRLLATALAGKVKQSAASVCLSVCPSVCILSTQLPGIESQGHRSRVRVSRLGLGLSTD